MANYYCGNCDLLDTKGRVYYGDEYYCKKDGKTHKTTSKACSSLIKNKDIREKEAKGWHPSGWKFYIVTAISEIIEELYGSDLDLVEKLSKIRYEYLETEPEYQSTVEEYDTFGPMIADIIRNHPEKNRIAVYLTNNYLMPAVRYILNDEIDIAAAIYFRMVEMLKTEFNLVNTVMDVPMEDQIAEFEYSLIRKPNKKSDI